MLIQVSFLLREKLDFIEEKSDFPIGEIPQRVYNKYRNQGEEVIKMNDETGEWIRWIISTVLEMCGLWLAWKSAQEKPSHRKLRKKHKR